ncbi:MAG: restriction endonuclease [Magnetococcales bacterium]|nr:restriction endonuclease [Magnetococcales bacterium]
MSFSADGILFKVSPSGIWPSNDHSIFGSERELAQLLTQIEDEGFASSEGNTVNLEWANMYCLMESPDYCKSIKILDLPPIECWRPSLESNGSLTDSGFTITLAGWKSPNGKRPRGNALVNGAILKVDGREILLPKAVWETIEAVSAFHRSREERNNGKTDLNRLGWANIRSKALGSADLSNFLAKTVVVTPEKLNIDMRQAEGTSARVVEIIPGFSNQPARWMEIFDRLGNIPERYEIPDGEGLTHVLVSPEVRTVLQEIKHMPGRRIAGDRAEAFLRNPFSTLGPAAESVIEPDQFECARDAAGISFARFTARIRRDENGNQYEAALLIEESLGGEIKTEEYKFESADDIDRFLVKLDARMSSEAQCCHWEGFDLEILGDTPDQAKSLYQVLEEMRKPQEFNASELLDISNYSERIHGFGIEQPYYSPFIARKNEDGGWFPDNVEFGVLYTPESGGETVAVSLSGEMLTEFRDELTKAKEEKRELFSFPGCPKPIPVTWAEGVIDTIGNVSNDVRKGSFDPDKPRNKTQTKPTKRKGLVVKPNVDTLDYEERRGMLALPPGTTSILPGSLKPDISLKDYQQVGVAWLQHLWTKSPTECRGVLLADDMGLGKTVQLLAFMASALENNPDIDPFLVIAPVSLLENWKEEIDKFFQPGTFRVLTLYGADLAHKRLPRNEVDKELAMDGIIRLLRRNWLDDAQIVLTTYETLRDLEFSLALQKWSVIICDEAQKIKNPNAMVTRAAKKQNAQFKIACTGTPVENTLTDIWCLFDFIQPGLLGALKEFGTRYRKPIEAETDDDKSLIEELRSIIGPQTLRRTKAEVAKDLPDKIEVPECRTLPISEHQRALYADAVTAFQGREDSSQKGGSSHLGLLQYLRRLCSDPQHPGSINTHTVSSSEIETHSPKMKWLMGQIKIIKNDDEKAIIFCEFRDLQRTLQRVVFDRFKLTPDIINGDTSASSKNANNRQQRIKTFQQRPGFGVIILSPLAVGFGVNIQAANHVIHFTRTWNPAKEDQATDRAYRIGQTRDVFVYYPVVVAKDFLTFDAKLDALLEWKRSLSTDMLNGTGNLKPSDFGDLGAPGGGSAFGDELLTFTDIESLDGDAFEAFCAILWSKLGFSNTKRTVQSGDGGVDVVAISGKIGVLIQCKSSSVDDSGLGWDAVKEVVGGKSAYAARYPGVRFSLVAVTNSTFNATAKMQARHNHVDLIDGNNIVELLRKHPVKRGELSSYMFDSWEK